MKQLLIKKGNIEIDEVPLPACPERGVLVKNHYSLISAGTESMLLKEESGGLLEKVKKQPHLLQKALESVKQTGLLQTIDLVKEEKDKTLYLGYSTAGIVIQTGRKCGKFSVGQSVACAGAGLANHSEYVAIPENLCVVIPSDLSLKEGAFTTVGSIALQGVRQGKISLGENVVVMGLGLIGLLTVQIVKAAGANVIGIDIDADKMEFAHKTFGIGTGCVDDNNLHDLINSWSEGIGADCVLITASTPSNQPVEQALRFARRKGRVVVVGGVGMNIPRSPFYEKELEFTISCSYGPGRYDPMYEEKGIDYPIDYVRWTENRNMGEFLRMVQGKKINLLSMITSEYELDKAKGAFLEVMEAEKKPIGVLIRYETNEEVLAKKTKLKVDAVPRTKKVLTFAVIGCGNHAKVALFPALSQIEEIDLVAVVGRTGKSAQFFGKKYEADYCTADYNEVMNDENVDFVVIATRHNLHYEIIMKAIEAGKDIFVEKPVALNMRELVEIREALEKKPVNFTAGYNRRFSSFSQKVKEILSQQPRPFFINYNVNAGFLPKNHWINDPEEGGGRIVGEVCHFIDLSNFFVGADLVGMNVQAIPINNSTVVAEDNISLELQYSDGSISVITYCSFGNSKFSKERIEIHANHKTILINNFEEIEFFGIDEKMRSLSKPDKGFKNQFVEFIKKIKGEPSMSISPEESIQSTHYAIKAVELLRGFNTDIRHSVFPKLT